MALIAGVEMVIAFFYAHFPRGGAPVENAGELPLLYALVWLFLAANGAGPLSADGRLRPPARP